MASKRTKKTMNATTVVKYVALSANALYILWLLYNAIIKGFKATPVELMPYMILLFLLGINIYLLISKE